MSSASAARAIALPNCVAAYQFASAGGTSITDSKGSNTGLIVGGAVQSTTDTIAGSDGIGQVSTDGVTGSPRLPALGLADDFSTVLHVAKAAAQPSGAYPMIISQDNGMQIAFQPTGSPYVPQGIALVDSRTGKWFAYSNVAITDLAGHRIGVSKNGAACNIYIDGVDQTTIGGDPSTPGVPTFVNGVQPYTWLASNYDSSTSGDFAQLIFDQAFFYSAALTAGQHASIDGAVTTPVVTINAVSSITTTTAHLSGTVNPEGFAGTAFFQYGSTSAFGSTTAPVTVSSGLSTPQTITADLSGLTPGQTEFVELSFTY